jgi:hypothetical protein
MATILSIAGKIDNVADCAPPAADVRFVGEEADSTA